MQLRDGEKTSLGARAITSEIMRAIESGSYYDGDQLPPERDLAETYSTSRSTIRKALSNLEKTGHVVRKIGSGTFVCYTNPEEDHIDNVVEITSPIHLIEARIGFERQMARLAAIHATKKDLESMGVVLEKMEGCTYDKEEFTRWDTEFHLLLARATRNPLIIHLYKQINEIRGHDQWKMMKKVILTPEQIDKYNMYHRQIFVALSNRDVTTAITALNGHMELARQDLIGAEDQL